MSHNARRSFLAGFPTLAAFAGVAPRLEAPRTPGRDLERLRLCAQFVGGNDWRSVLEVLVESVYERRAVWNRHEARCIGPEWSDWDWRRAF